MKVFLLLFFTFLPLGQVGGLMIKPGIVIYLHDLVVPLILLATFINRRNRTYLNSFLSVPIGIFGLTAAISLAINAMSYSPDEVVQSALYLVRWLAYSGIYFAVVGSNMPTRIWLGGVFISGLIFALFGYLQYIYYPTLRNLYYLGWDEHYYRLFSTFFDPNFAGIYLTLTLFLGFYLHDSSQHKVLFLIAEIFITIAIIMTYSRSSILSLIFGFVVWFVLKRKFVYGILIALCLASVFILLPTRGRDILSVMRPESALSRLGSWRQSLNLFLEKPVLGFGFNTLRWVQTSRGWVHDESIPSRSAAGVDSSLLFVLITTGIVGFVAFAFLISQVAVIGFTALRIADPYLGLSFMASLAAVMVHSFFVNSLFYPWVVLWIWILVGTTERRITFRT